MNHYKIIVLSSMLFLHPSTRAMKAPHTSTNIVTKKPRYPKMGPGERELLFRAGQTGDLPFIQKFVTHYGPDIIHEKSDVTKSTLFHEAAEHGYSDMLEYLRSLPCSTNPYIEKDLFGNTPMHLAAAHGHTKMFKDLASILGNEQTRTQKNSFGYTSFHNAIHNAHFEIAQYILSIGNDPLWPTYSKDSTPYHLAAGKENPASMRYLLSIPDIPHCDYLTQKDHSDWTPLMYTAIKGNLKTMKAIVAVTGAKALQNQTNKDKQNSLHLAAAKGHIDVAEYVVSVCGVKSLYRADNSNNTPLHLAARNGRTNVIEFFLSKYLLLDYKKYNNNGYSIVRVCPDTKKKELRKILKKHMLNLQPQTPTNQTIPCGMVLCSKQRYLEHMYLTDCCLTALCPACKPNEARGWCNYRKEPCPSCSNHHW